MVSGSSDTLDAMIPPMYQNQPRKVMRGLSFPAVGMISQQDAC